MKKFYLCNHLYVMLRVAVRVQYVDKLTHSHVCVSDFQFVLRVEVTH